MRGAARCRRSLLAVRRRGARSAPGGWTDARNLKTRWNVRQRVHETQLALLYSKHVGIRQPADAERAKRDHRSHRLVDDETPRDDVDAAGHAHLAAILREAFSGANTAFRPFARIAPRH